MLSVPSVGQMLSVIGVALVAVIVLTGAVSLLLDHLTRRTATALNDTPALQVTPDADTHATVPGQRTPARLAHTH
jgi:hypothetical protein